MVAAGQVQAARPDGRLTAARLVLGGAVQSCVAAAQGAAPHQFLHGRQDHLVGVEILLHQSLVHGAPFPGVLAEVAAITCRAVVVGPDEAAITCIRFFLCFSMKDARVQGESTKQGADPSFNATHQW